MAIHYFVVAHDTDTGRWSIDADTEQIRFSDGTIYDTDTETWCHDYTGLDTWFPNAKELLDVIQSAIQNMNMIATNKGAE